VQVTETVIDVDRPVLTRDAPGCAVRPRIVGNIVDLALDSETVRSVTSHIMSISVARWT
jgi:hypothetical protein